MQSGKRRSASAASSVPQKRAGSNTPRQIRIIGGQWKRTPLSVVDGEGLRPTPDRVRETVFNWLHHLFDGQWQERRGLDLFAGSGGLGYEAASREIGEILMVEQYAPAYKQLELVRDKLQAKNVKLNRSDAFAFVEQLRRQQQSFDVIFLDPPFHRGFLEKILPMCVDLLRADGLVYVEGEQPLTADQIGPWTIVRQDKAGMVHFQLLQCNKDLGNSPQNLG